MSRRRGSGGREVARNDWGGGWGARLCLAWLTVPLLALIPKSASIACCKCIRNIKPSSGSKSVICANTFLFSRGPNFGSGMFTVRHSLISNVQFSAYWAFTPLVSLIKVYCLVFVAGILSNPSRFFDGKHCKCVSVVLVLPWHAEEQESWLCSFCYQIRQQLNGYGAWQRRLDFYPAIKIWQKEIWHIPS